MGHVANDGRDHIKFVPEDRGVHSYCDISHARSIEHNVHPILGLQCRIRPERWFVDGRISPKVADVRNNNPCSFGGPKSSTHAHTFAVWVRLLGEVKDSAECLDWKAGNGQMCVDLAL